LIYRNNNVMGHFRQDAAENRARRAAHRATIKPCLDPAGLVPCPFRYRSSAALGKPSPVRGEPRRGALVAPFFQNRFKPISRRVIFKILEFRPG